MALEFGPLLRVYRSYWELTQKDMAELLCISQPVYSRIEAGRRPVSMKSLQRVADRSGISLQTLVMAHLLLDENLDAMANGATDPATKSLIQLAEGYKKNYPPQMKDAAALGLLLSGLPE